MLGLALTLTSLTTTWTYAGFVASPPPPAPPAAPTIPSAPSGPPWPPAAPLVRPIAPAPPVIRYRMADATGQLWEHLDPAVLQAFIVERNARLVRPQPVVRRFGSRR